MKRKLSLAMPLFLTLGACSIIAPNRSSSSSKANYVFNDDVRASLNAVLEKYENRYFGDFKTYQFVLYDSEQTQRAKADEDKNYYCAQYIGPSTRATGFTYLYKTGDDYIDARDITQNGANSKKFRYLTAPDFAASVTEFTSAPYQFFPDVLKGIADATEEKWSDVEVSNYQDDGSGNIDLTFKGKDYDESAKKFVDDPITVTVAIKDYKITRISNPHGYSITFNENHSTPSYPDLSLYTQEGERPSEGGSSTEGLVVEDNHRTYYQLLVYSFADGNGDYIGDFKGIVDKLDYLQNLGIQGLWLSPVLKASSYHAYDIDDYFAIRPEYEPTVNGVKYDVKYLLDECHKRNIKVLMDLVLNHTSTANPWYRDHRNWYGSDNKFGFPELNYDLTEVRNAVADVGRYWLDKGFDGFRLDAAMWIYNSGNDRHQKNYNFWKQWCQSMRAKNPNCYLIAEVLDENHDLAYNYAAAGFDSTFDFNALARVYGAVKNNESLFARNTASDIKKATDVNPDYILGRALSNHDIGRFNQEHPDSSDKAYWVDSEAEIKLGNAINTLVPGNAFIYYGDELGLKGTCEDTYKDWYYDMNFRTPMPWASGATRSTVYFEDFHGSGVTTSRTLSGRTPEQDAASTTSIYAALKDAIAVKNSSETLQKGTIGIASGLDNSLNGFDVTYQGETIRVAFRATNVSGEVSLAMPNAPLYNLGATISGNTAKLGPNDLVVYKL